MHHLKRPTFRRLSPTVGVLQPEVLRFHQPPPGADQGGRPYGAEEVGTSD
ncbi:hypothetical protein ACH4LN_28015 [Streptomyces albus]